MNKFQQVMKPVKENKAIVIRRILIGTAVVTGVALASGLLKIKVKPSESAAHLAEEAANGLGHVADTIARAAE